MSDFDSQDLRQAFGAFATGVTVVTTAFEGKRYGVTANSGNKVAWGSAAGRFTPSQTASFPPSVILAAPLSFQGRLWYNWACV